MYNKNIYQLLEYGKFLKKELLELYFELENKDNYKIIDNMLLDNKKGINK